MEDNDMFDGSMGAREAVAYISITTAAMLCTMLQLK